MSLNPGYGAKLLRYKQIKTGLSGGTQTLYYVDKLLEVEKQGNRTTYRHYFDGVAVLHKEVEGAATTWTMGFNLKDRLGSVVTLADDNGDVLEHRSYDPFGKPRRGDFIDAGTIQSAIALDPHQEYNLDPLTDRGFTDHEHLDEQQIIHMNGRVFDYNIGRFSSVDPIIQSPSFSQSINPYSYIMNNPLAGTDPSGYEAEEDKNSDEDKARRDLSDERRKFRGTANGIQYLIFSGPIPSNNGSSGVSPSVAAGSGVVQSGGGAQKRVSDARDNAFARHGSDTDSDTKSDTPSGASIVAGVALSADISGLGGLIPKKSALLLTQVRRPGLANLTGVNSGIILFGHRDNGFVLGRNAGKIVNRIVRAGGIVGATIEVFSITDKLRAGENPAVVITKSGLDFLAGALVTVKPYGTIVGVSYIVLDTAYEGAAETQIENAYNFFGNVERDPFSYWGGLGHIERQ